ncbi:hypothetical protein RAN3_4124 [plant metagenome]|uniref:Uncharacterized protein n=1 Tax=plant metagenome TaxID=1297885 RepID=A0A484UZ84_9ZZZZ
MHINGVSARCKRQCHGTGHRRHLETARLALGPGRNLPLCAHHCPFPRRARPSRPPGRPYPMPETSGASDRKAARNIVGIDTRPSAESCAAFFQVFLGTAYLPGLSSAPGHCPRHARED